MKPLYMKPVRMYDGNVLVLEYGKVGVANHKRKTNMVEVEFGFRSLEGNSEPYFTVTHSIWNCKHTDIIQGGLGVDILFKYFRNNHPGRQLLNDLNYYYSKYHLKFVSAIPEEDRKNILGLLYEYQIKM